MSEKRPVYIISYSSPHFPAHWAMWIPSYSPVTTSPPTTITNKGEGEGEGEGHAGIGKIIQVTGDSRSGFMHQFKRNYDLTGDERKRSLTLVGWVDVKMVVDGGKEEIVGGDEGGELRAVDGLEEWALGVPAPGPSLRAVTAASGSSSSGPPVPKRVQIKNCQTWIRELVGRLEEEGVFIDDDDDDGGGDGDGDGDGGGAVERVDGVPRN